ncbi:hypothetical protein F991_01711 [Acinetobacter sp. CIP-A165]|nr:hypothetical protein F991_01711 [Acinetobacter sp. CIP-A165]
MMKIISMSLLTLSCFAAFNASANNDFIDNTKFTLDSRLRFEMVDQDNPLKKAEAATLRIRPALQTGTWQGLSLFAQGEATIELNDRFNSTRNNETKYSSVPDPENLDINQLYLNYSNPKFDARLGRQVINLDNQRLIGSVGWRQNEQSYDAVSLNLKPTQSLQVYYAYIDQVNTIFGSEDPKPIALIAQDGEQDSQIHLAQIKYNYSPQLNAVLYGYFIDFENLNAWSNQTYGLRLTGKQNNFRYAAEYAKQQDYADQPITYDADYYAVELGYQISGKSPIGEVAVGYEVLSSDNGKIAFQTPLATKHKFNGWTDMFLNTPVNGLRDAYISSSFNIFSKGKLMTELHHYRSDEKGLDYGQEFALSYAQALPIKGLSGLAKFSRYQAEDFGVDTDKLWLQLDYKY